MEALLVHFYFFSEIYTVLLCWAVVPLIFAAAFIYFSRHLSMAPPVELAKVIPIRPTDGDGAAATESPTESPAEVTAEKVAHG